MAIVVSFSTSLLWGFLTLQVGKVIAQIDSKMVLEINPWEENKTGSRKGDTICRRRSTRSCSRCIESGSQISSRRVFNLNTIRTIWQGKLLHKWFIKLKVKPMCSIFCWPDRIQFEILHRMRLSSYTSILGKSQL